MNSGNWVSKYALDCDLKYPSLCTRKVYKSCVTQFLYHFQSYHHPKEIPTQDIKVWVLEAKSINSRKHRICAVKSFYKLTMHIPKKIDRISYPKGEKKLPQPLCIQEVQRMISCCTNIKHKAIICILFACGLRRSELINLKIKDINSIKMVIHIIGAKGNKDRNVTLDIKLLELLREYYKKFRPTANSKNKFYHSNQYWLCFVLV